MSIESDELCTRHFLYKIRLQFLLVSVAICSWYEFFHLFTLLGCVECAVEQKLNGEIPSCFHSYSVLDCFAADGASASEDPVSAYITVIIAK